MEIIRMVEITPQQLSEVINNSLKIEIKALLKDIELKERSHPEFLTRKETAEYFKVSLVCLHEWCKKGIIKPYKVGNRTYFKYSELVDLVLNSNKNSVL